MFGFLCVAINAFIHAVNQFKISCTLGLYCLYSVQIVVVCCHPDPLLHPPDTTTPLLARYLLIKIWLPGNILQVPVNFLYNTCSFNITSCMYLQIFVPSLQELVVYCLETKF